MSEKETVLEINNLKKSYKKGKEVLHGISFNIKKGEFVGILGSNGAGKTTTINCIAGISTPTEGEIKVFNYDTVKDYKEARKKIGLSPQEFTVDTFQTPKELLYFQAGFFGIIGKEREERIKNLLNIFELNEHKDKKFQFLSGGLKRRTIVAKSLIHNPEIIILDEPTAGVDVETRKSIWKYLELLKKENKTLILTSHYLEEIESLCDRVLIVQNGNIVYESSMKDVKENGKLEELYLKLIENNK